MVFKLNELQATVAALQGILTQKLPIKAAYWLGKFLKKAWQEIQDFEAGRTRLCEQYCRKDDEGKIVRLKRSDPKDPASPLVEAEKGYEDAWSYDLTENREAFNKGFKELGEVEVAFDFRPFKLEDLGEKIEATAEEMAALMAFIVEPEAEKEEVGTKTAEVKAAKTKGAEPKAADLQ